MLGIESITEADAIDTLNILLKYQSDITRATKELSADATQRRPGVPRTS
jgi:hypothetical protein